MWQNDEVMTVAGSVDSQWRQVFNLARQIGFDASRLSIGDTHPGAREAWGFPDKHELDARITAAKTATA